MPTATMTATAQAPSTLKLKAPASSAQVTLQTLYHRAARAFLLRQVSLVHSLLESAFVLLHPPQQLQDPDEFAVLRSKWDLLRITFETTVYTSPPDPSASDLPHDLRQLAAQPPHIYINSTYQRSLKLFTPPAVPAQASHIPSSVILTLAYSSLKVDAADSGRVVIEDWLASRQYAVVSEKDADDGYQKAVEAYCLHILPKLEQWEYAKEFLDYESELAPDVRKNIQATLETSYAQAIAAKLPPPKAAPRPHSPTPSNSSSSSSLSSTASAHTVLPSTPRPRSNLTRRTPSTISDSTATPRARSAAVRATSPPQHSASLPRLYTPGAPTERTPPLSGYELIRATLAPYLTPRAKLSLASLVTFLLLFAVPLLVRRRRTKSIEPAAGNAEAVRRRLVAAHVTNTSAGWIRQLLMAILRVVGDTVRMAGSGLV
ncbi:unnamed protein product [Mycena citricolor]|uniref:Uncharacterized protein n=1 Tax=Mycena citricolor TaxID=2018698 RepID=A0AAD2JWF5_9AGAR|nr:unnamed protein product [Mycena citricolor]